MSYRRVNHPGALYSGVDDWIWNGGTTKPRHFWYPFPAAGTSSRLVVPDWIRGNNLVSNSSMNSNTPQYYAEFNMTASRLSNTAAGGADTEEWRAELSEGDTGLTKNGYPFSLVACVAIHSDRDHNILTLMDPSGADSHVGINARSVAGVGSVSNRFDIYHQSYGGGTDIQAGSGLSTLNYDRFYVVSGQGRINSSGNVACHIRVIDTTTGVFESDSASNASANQMSGNDRISIGYLSDTTPSDCGDFSIAWAGIWNRFLSTDELRALAKRPLAVTTDHPFSPVNRFLPVIAVQTITPNVSPRASQFDRSLLVPFPDWHDPKELFRQHAEVMEGILEGGLRSLGEFTLTASATSTVVEERRCGPASVILLMPTTANAADMTSIWFSAIGEYNANDLPSFTVNHDSDAATDRTYRYFVVGSSGGLV